MNQNKLGLGIIAFEGTELIATIVAEIRDLVDYIVIGFQEFSYTGDKCDPNDKAEVLKLKEEGFVDEVIFIETDHSDFPRVQETEKRNRLVENIAAHGCTHELIIDSDEFYTHDAFQRAKERVYEENIEMSYCRYVNYFHDFKHYLVFPFEEGQYVPFIAKVEYKFEWNCQDFKLPSDPTRRFVRPKEPLFDKNGKPVMVPLYNEKGEVTKTVQQFYYTKEYYAFPWKELKMHHLSWIRANIRKKMNAWSSKLYFQNYLEIIDKSAERFQNFSEENIKDGAFLLFNTPNNKVDIASFQKQYIFPKIDYHTRVHNEPNTDTRIVWWNSKDNKATILELCDYFASLVKYEQYSGPNDIENRDQRRIHKTFDYLVVNTKGQPLSQEEIDEKTDFIQRLRDDSKIFIEETNRTMILSFESLLKIAKTIGKEDFTNDVFQSTQDIFKRYSQKIGVEYENFIIKGE